MAVFVGAASVPELLRSGVAVPEGTTVAVPEPSDAGEPMGPGVAGMAGAVGVAVAGTVDLPAPGAPGGPEAAGPLAVLGAVMSNDVTTSPCPAARVHGTSTLPGPVMSPFASSGTRCRVKLPAVILAPPGSVEVRVGAVPVAGMSKEPVAGMLVPVGVRATW